MLRKQAAFGLSNLRTSTALTKVLHSFVVRLPTFVRFGDITLNKFWLQFFQVCAKICESFMLLQSLMKLCSVLKCQVLKVTLRYAGCNFTLQFSNWRQERWKPVIITEVWRAQETRAMIPHNAFLLEVHKVDAQWKIVSISQHVSSLKPAQLISI